MPHSRRKTSKRIAVSQSDKPETVKRRSSQNWERRLQDVFFFTFFFFYLWLYVDLRLIYHGAGIITNFPVFYKGWSFFLPFLSYPGGPVEYLSAFLSQLFYISWAGALVITIQAWLIGLCIEDMLKTTKSLRMRGIRFFLPICLLALYTQYIYYFTTTMAFLTVLLTTCIYLKATLLRSKNVDCGGIFLILSIILYYLSGGAFLLFAMICALYEWMFRSRWKISLFYLFCTGGIPYIVGLLIFGVSSVDAFSNVMPFSWRILKYNTRTRAIEFVYTLYLLPLFVLFMTGLWQMHRTRRPSERKTTGRKSGKKHRNTLTDLPVRIFSWYGHSPKLKFVTGLLILFTITGGAVFFSRDENLRTRFKIDYCAYHKMWLELLISARQNPADPFVNHAVNRALYHSGRLGYDMFSWPQFKSHLFLTDEKFKRVDWQVSDLYLDIGLVNMAENAMTECLEALGDRPMILQRLALINMVKGNLGSATIYLGALSKTLFHGEWARQYLDRLRIDPTLSSDSYIQHLRSVCLDRDCPVYSLLSEKTLLWLLEKNGQNRMAFEYLMTWYMLNRSLSKLAQKMELLPKLGYTELPRHYEEAALIYVFKTRKSVPLSNYPPNPRIRRQIEEFSRILKAHGGNKGAALKDLSKSFCNTYFFYNIYAPSGTDR